MPKKQGESTLSGPSLWDLAKHSFYQWTVNSMDTTSVVDPSWRKHLSRPTSLYAVSSFFYSFIGLFLLLSMWLCPGSAIHGWPPHYAKIEAYLVIVQGAWSYFSDVIDIGISSRWHALDRVSAISLTVSQFVKFGVRLVGALSIMETVWVLAVLLVGVFFKVGDYNAIIKGDMLAYERSHFYWHLTFPLGFGIFSAWRWYMCIDCAAIVA